MFKSISQTSICRPSLYTRRGFSTSPVWSKFNILFCGSDEFSVRNLDTLRSAPDLWESIHVLTPRLRKLPIPLLEYANKHRLSATQVPPGGIAAYNLPSEFKVPNPRNVLVTASFGHIIPNSFLRHFGDDKRLNVHPSLLPKYRGAAPIQWTIAHGDTSTGVSIQRLVDKGKGIDGGDLVGVVDGIEVASNATYDSLLDDVAGVGGKVLVDVLRRIQDETDKGVPQDPAGVTRAPKITHETAKIDWPTQTASQVDRLSRGISHQYPLWTVIDGVPVQIFQPTPVEIEGESERPGTAKLLRKQGALVVACADGWVRVERVKSQGKKEVGVNDWWNGLPKGLREGKTIKLG